MRNRLKKVKGVMPAIDIQSYDDETIHSPFLAALQNPDLMSDEMAAFPERDFDEEFSRAQYLEKFKQALTTLTPKQRSVIEALQKYDNQEQAADELGIARSTIAVTLRQIQKKISKFINKLENER